MPLLGVVVTCWVAAPGMGWVAGAKGWAVLGWAAGVRAAWGWVVGARATWGWGVERGWVAGARAAWGWSPQAPAEGCEE